MRKRSNIKSNEVEIKIQGLTHPKFKRREFVNQLNGSFDIPNGDIRLGRNLYDVHCSECHHLDIDSEQGPALRTIYLRKSGTRRGFKNYSYTYLQYPFYWSRVRLWEYIENPENISQDTTSSFEGISDPILIASLVEYLVYLGVKTIPVKSVRKNTKIK